MTHTTGLWTVRDARSIFTRTPSTPEHTAPYYVIERRDSGYKTLIARTGSDALIASPHDGDARSNAQLIAAAPRLLDALRDLIDYTDPRGAEPALARARAALRFATDTTETPT